MAGKWSAQETAFLKELLTVHTVREARQKLGRSEYAVRKQMRKLKDSKDPVRYEDMNREDGENIRRMYKRAENKVERLKILKDLYPSYTKETILAAALHNPFRESDKFYEQITKEQNEVKKVIGRYDEETKAAAVRAILLDGEKVTTVAERYGISDQTVYNWVKRVNKTQQQFMDYAEKVEEDLAEEQGIKTEDVFPATHFKPVNNQEEIQRTKAEERELTDLEWAEKYVDSVIDNFKKAEELLIQMAYDDPDRVALEEKLEKELFRDEAERRKHNPDYNKLSIKAAAFDEICGIGAEYPDRRERELLFYINGIIGLAERLRGGNIWN